MQVPSITKAQGFTLIEVLIAVIILAIALVAVVKNTTLSANETSYLQQRSIAHWTAMDIMAQVHSGQIAITQTGNNRNGTVTQLGQQWKWQVQSNSTAQTNILKIDVNVFNAVDNKKYDSVTSYLLLRPKTTS